ncbi:SpaH/EbpB family LPXTG-anchored major pilin [Corynebacterium cystitidis]|uniref:SpaH/EbpB family LPXTG-anchored major pilin n=1 Tax=Corynebacterium cystitidis TaxID=35757 RepID=UPI00211F25E7|nr:SpaH/EbpB family LPXTG-anchored major pilin [Corynebacterium cystitidis]
MNNNLTAMGHRASSVPLRIIVAFFLAFLLGFQAVPAHADAPAASLVDPSRTGNLTVIKGADDPLTVGGDPENPGKVHITGPVAGMTFTAKQVKDVDLTTNEGWRKVADTKVQDFLPGGINAGKLESEPHRATTGEDGKAHFNGLPLGLYLIEEEVPKNYNSHLTPINPFLVTLPRTDTVNRDYWVYDVTVYPKNQKHQTTKKGPVCVDPGDTGDFGASASAPDPGKDGVIDRYQLIDELPEGLTYKKDSSKVYLTQHDNADKIQLEDGKHYTVTEQTGYLDMSLTDEGLRELSKLSHGNPNAKVTWHFTLHFDKNMEEGKYAKNIVRLSTTGYPAYNIVNKPGVPSNEVEVEVGCGETPPPHTPPPGTPPGKTPPPGTPPGKEIPPLPVPIPPYEPEPWTPGEERVVADPEPQPTPPTILAETGANVWMVILAGVGLILLGFYMMAAKRRR